MSVSIFQLARYMYVETTFTLNDFEYEFATEDKVDGPIRLLRYKGIALNLVIPKDIDGHYISSIGPEAFTSTSVRSIVINGNPLLEADAFRDCRKLESVEIINVETIGDYAFAGCTKLKTITVGENLKQIGKYSFNACRSLEGIDLPEGLELLDKYAFRECKSIESLVIPDAIQFIGEGILQACDIVNLTTPYVGSSIDEITTLGYFYGYNTNFHGSISLSSITVTQQSTVPDKSFYNCTELKHVDFSKEITEIGDSAFSGCTSLLKFDIDKTVKYIGCKAFYDCQSVDGLLIPEGIQKIEDETFYNCYSLSTIDIPYSVKLVGEAAFNGCRSLTTLKVSDQVQSIGKNAFANCTSLLDVTIPFIGYSSSNSTTAATIFGEDSIGNIQVLRITGPMTIVDSAFENMISLREIYLNDHITEIGESAFANCKSLNTINLHKYITSIGNRAFYACSSLTSLEIPEGIEAIGESMFEDCESLKSIYIPQSATDIGVAAFKNCASLNQLSLPESVVSIGESAFAECTSLEQINIPEAINKINASTFENCSALASVNIPTLVTEINDRAFANCALLSNLTLSDQLQIIGNSAFVGCQTFTSLSIPTSVNFVGAGIVEGCTSLEALSIPFMCNSADGGESGQIGYLFDVDEASNSKVPTTLTSVTLLSVQTISEKAFEDCSSIIEISLPETTTAIKGNAFKNCASLSKIDLPDAISTVDKAAFENCVAITEASFSEKLEYIDGYVFSGCTSLETVLFKEGVTSIGEHVFDNCSSLKEINLPKSINSIGLSIFAGCYSIEEITVPFIGSSQETPYTISYFFGETSAEGLKSINITNAQTISGEAFKALYNLKEVKLNEGITLIGSDAFAGCSSLAEIIIPSSVTYMGDGIFSECSSLSSLSIPFAGNEKGVAEIQELFGYSIPTTLKTITVTAEETIPSNTFAGCSNIETIIIDCPVISIGDSAFQYCTSLKNISIPETLASIGENAFYDCSNLKSITLPEGLEEIGESAFYNCFKLCEVYNYSGNYIEAGKLDYGYVALYAINVYTKDDTVHRVQHNGFTFIKEVSQGGEWYLIDYTLNDSGGCNLPEYFEYEDNSIYQYNLAFSLFREDMNLTEIYFSNAVQKMDESIFYSCSNLKYADLSNANLNSIPQYTFENCRALTEAKISSQITQIENYAFRNCESLTKIDLPTELTSIGREAFNYCIALKSITLHENVTEIKNGAFTNCMSLHEIYDLCPLSITLGSYDNGEIAYYAFIIHNDPYVESLTEVVVGDLIFEKSESNWFLSGHNAEDGVLELTPFWHEGTYISSYTIPRFAMVGSGRILTIKFSDAVKKINREAFSGHYEIRNIDFGSNNSLTEADIVWLADLGETESIVFPTSLTNFPTDIVSSLNSPKSISFKGNYNIYTIPNEAFYECYSLETITLPNYTSNIESYAFAYCSSLTEIDLSSCTSIGTHAFYECLSLKSVVLSDYLEAIPSYAFYRCTSLKDISLPAYLLTIGSSAFRSCSSLTQIRIPSNVTSIANLAFAECNKLYEIWNESNSLSVLPEATANGYLAYYAVVVHAKNDAPLEFYEVTKNDREFTFAYDPSTAKTYLVGIANCMYSNVVLPDISKEYIVTGHAAKNGTDNVYIYSLLVPDSVVEIRSGFFNSISNYFTVYYTGTATEWYSRFSNIGEKYTLYTYSECIHDDDYLWRYDEDGNPTTSFSTVESKEVVITPPSCYNSGLTHHVCKKCEYVFETEYVPQLAHSPNSDGVCTNCKDAIYVIDCSSDYTFDRNSNGEYISNNVNVDGTTALMTFTAKMKMEVTIVYSVSSEQDYDIFTIFHNNTAKVEKSGTVENRRIILTLNANDVIKFQYSKNADNYSGNDNAIIYSISVECIN